MRCISMLALAMLAGCAAIDTGVVDFRRAENLSAKEKADRRIAFMGACTFQPKGQDPKSCDPMYPSRLYDKFSPTPADFIATGDVFSIRLDYGIIAEMTEWPKISFRSKPDFRKNGEVAVLVNAFEFSDKPGDALNRFFDIGQLKADPNDPSKKISDFADARVVYFSPDVDQGQPLNISNIPIIGPVEYHGRPIGLQIIVIELDAMSEAVRSMLKNLADLGKTYAGASSTGLTDTLFELGKSLLDGSQDDIIFEYRMVMDNGAYIGVHPVSAFQTGRLVFRRIQDRQNTFVWRNTVLDQNTGALFSAQPGPQNVKTFVESAGGARADFSAYKKETYFTVNVINHGPDGPVGIYENKTWSQVSSAFEAYVENTQAPLAAATDELKKLIEKRRSLNASSAGGTKTDSALDRWRQFGLTMVTPPAAPDTAETQAQKFPDYADLPSVDAKAQCVASWKALLSKAAEAPVLRSRARTATLEMLELLLAATTPDPTTQDTTMKTSEFDLAVRRFWHGAVDRFRLTLAEQQANEREFESGAKFATAYLGANLPNAENLQTLLEGYARKLEPKDCATAVARSPS